MNPSPSSDSLFPSFSSLFTTKTSTKKTSFMSHTGSPYLYDIRVENPSLSTLLSNSDPQPLDGPVILLWDKRCVCVFVMSHTGSRYETL